MTEFNEDTLVTCPLCDSKFTIMVDDYGIFNEQCPNCDVHYTIAKELAEFRAMRNLVSLQKVFSDVSGLLLAFEDIIEDMTLGELLAWIVNVLEGENIDVEDEQVVQLRLPRVD